jgi:BirA family biotin operon repressor/biotin-[acetyl-CoA-carboxylase] ligase
MSDVPEPAKSERSIWPFARTVVHRETVGSTNDLAKELLRQEDPEFPLLVITSRQTAGRGRGTHTWWSDRGSLAFSVAIDPNAYGLTRAHEARISLATAVGVIDALDAFLAPGRIGIRWPNDLEADDRKLGGILPERLETSSGSRVVIGVGLNVHSQLNSAPPEIRALATSLRELGAPSLELFAVLDAILRRIGPSLVALAREDASLVARWQQLDTLRGQRIRVDLGREIVTGWCRGIDPHGAICLETDRGLIALHGGQVLREPVK